MDKLSTLWQGASYQDHLLQAYRKLHFCLQCAFLLMGSGSCVATIAFKNSSDVILSYGLLIVFTLASLYLLRAMSKLIAARAEDVDYYHQQIIESEKMLPGDEQILTAFKVYQKFGRYEKNTSKHFAGFVVDDSIRKQLIEKSKGHARKILDQHVTKIFLVCWIFIHIISIVSILNR
jgi:hypothetical protein